MDIFPIKVLRSNLGTVATGLAENWSTNLEGSRTLTVDNLQNYLDVLSHLTSSLLHFRGKLFRGGMYDQNPEDAGSDDDSDDENSSSSLGGKIMGSFLVKAVCGTILVNVKQAPSIMITLMIYLTCIF